VANRITGEKILSRNIENKNRFIRFKTENLPAGVYFVKLRTENKKIKRKIILIKRKNFKLNIFKKFS